jgi:hypothetical protein
MTERKWNSGPPPHIGWWNASALGSENYWRWWDGNGWSVGVHKDENPSLASRFARFKTRARNVEWTDYYPGNARVPRINPKMKP